VHNTTDLRGRTPGTASGTAITGGTEFADNQFKIFAVGDNTKIVDLDLSNIVTGNTRTIEIPNYDMVIPGGTVAGATVLYYAGLRAFATSSLGVGVYRTANPAMWLDIQMDSAGGADFYVKYPGAKYNVYGRNVGDSANNAMIVADPDGAAELYFAGVKKFETNTNGGEITGRLIIRGAVEHIYLFDTGDADSLDLISIQKTTDTFNIRFYDNSEVAYVSAFSATLAGATELYFAGAKTVETTATGLDTLFANEWTKQQGFNEDTITSSSNAVAWNLTTDQCTLHTLTEHTTISEPTNMQAGSTYHLRVIQAAGLYTLAWNAVFKWGVPGVPAAPAADGDYVVFSFYCDGTNMIGAEFNRTEA
jgi:hypothetical protein